MTCPKCGEGYTVTCACGYGVKAATPVRSTTHVQPLTPVMTKEELGIDLYEAIKAQSARRQCLKDVAVHTHHGRPDLAQKAQAKAEAYNQEVQARLATGTIGGWDVKRIYAMEGV